MFHVVSEINFHIYGITFCSLSNTKMKENLIEGPFLNIWKCCFSPSLIFYWSCAEKFSQQCMRTYTHTRVTSVKQQRKVTTAAVAIVNGPCTYRIPLALTWKIILLHTSPRWMNIAVSLCKAPSYMVDSNMGDDSVADSKYEKKTRIRKSK